MYAHLTDEELKELISQMSDDELEAVIARIEEYEPEPDPTESFVEVDIMDILNEKIESAKDKRSMMQALQSMHDYLEESVEADRIYWIKTVEKNNEYVRPTLYAFQEKIRRKEQKQ